MLSSPSVLQLSRPLPLATGATVSHYIHTAQACSILGTAMVLTGTTINSAASVLVTVEKLPAGGGAAVPVNTITMPTATTTGQAVTGSAIAAPIALAPGDVLRGTVTTAATVAGGDGYISISIVYK